MAPKKFKKDSKGKSRMTAAEKQKQVEEMQEREDRLEAEEAAAEAAKAAKGRQQKAKAAKAAEYDRRLAEEAKVGAAAARAEKGGDSSSSSEEDDRPWLYYGDGPSTYQPQPVKSKCKKHEPLVVTDQQEALQWAEWVTGLPQGLPEMYKLQKRYTQPQVRREETKESSDDDGHEADDEDP